MPGHNDILVSVVLPCYNAEAYILEAVHSILQQTHEKLELIVINDASTDASLHLLESVSDKRLFIISNNENTGYPTAMNIGIAQANGKYIARMDADDISASDRIEKQVALHESYPNCAFVSSKRCLMTPNGIAYSKETIIEEPIFVKEYWEDLFDGSRTFTDPACLILKKHIDAVGGYNTYLRSGMDVDLWFRIFEQTNAPVLVLNEFLFMRRLLPTAITFSIQTKNDLVREKASKRFLKKTYQPNKKPDTEGQKLKAHVRFLSTIAVHCLLVKDYNGFWIFIKKAMSYKKFIFESVCLNLVKKYYYFKKTNAIKIIDA